MKLFSHTKTMFTKAERAVTYLYEWLLFHILWLLGLHTQHTGQQQALSYSALSSFLSNTGKALVLLLGAVCLGLQQSLPVLLAAAMLVRIPALGPHALTNLGCLLHAMLLYWGGTLLALALPHSPLVLVLGTLACLALVLRYAPAASRHYFFGSAAARNRKIASAAMVSLLCAASFVLLFAGYATAANLVLVGALAQCLSLHPAAIAFMEAKQPPPSAQCGFTFQFKTPVIRRRALRKIASLTAAFVFTAALVVPVAAAACWQPIFGKAVPVPAHIRKLQSNSKW